jgi:hypothetical protein
MRTAATRHHPSGSAPRADSTSVFERYDSVRKATPAHSTTCRPPCGHWPWGGSSFCERPIEVTARASRDSRHTGVLPASLWRRSRALAQARSHFRYFVSGRHIRQRRKSNSPRATIPNAVPIASAGLLADKFAQPHSARIVFAVAALRLCVRSLIGVRAIFSRICCAHDPKFARRLCISAERWRFTRTVSSTAAAINPTLTTTTHPNLPTRESSHSCTDARSGCLTKRWRSRLSFTRLQAWDPTRH